MAETVPLQKAHLRQLDAAFADEIEPDTWVEVQFNPESLKVSFANQVVQPSGAGDQKGPQGRQFVGAGTTKLSLQLWFDVSAAPPEKRPPDDVRRLTQKVAYYITPKPVPGKPDQFVPPAVRFQWGTFQFDGLMDSLEETLEFFSPDGRPLRASLNLALSQQRITAFAFGKGGQQPPPRGLPTPGTRPLAQAPEGASVQDMVDRSPSGGDWQAVAQANGIENPRLLRPGQLLDLSARLPRR